MMGFRSATLTGLLAVTAIVAGCGGVDEPGFASDVERELVRGREYASALVTASRSEPAAAEAIATGYLERHRLGLGSPFRLIEQSLQDPRLEPSMRERLAWSLLARTLDGRGYRVDPTVLAGDAAERARHMELIEGAISGSPDAAGGELAVRLAYAMAGAEGAVPRRNSRVGAHVAAMVRDREVAQEDARRLLRAAGEGVDPLSLLTVWRVERRFAVESPAMLTLSREAERDAMERAPRLLRSIREIDDRPRRGPLVPTVASTERPLLGPEAAALLADLTTAAPSPPQTPVAVATDVYRRASSVDREPARDRFFDNADNEERLAAEYALLSHQGGLDRGVRLATLGAAVALRTYSQERPWFPGFDGPARRELEDRFGLASVAFPEDMPGEWRPYYRRMLQSALSDLQRVLPSLDLRGLKVRFEARAGSPGTLAVHDPRTRTVYIPALTGAGTIAHEIAHDLDWQTAVQRYRVRGDYATDRAMRTSDERLARVLRGLTTASLDTPPGAEYPTTGHATRPAEVFARSVDWFVAAALAREGRVNGYLSSVQDDLLTGYGTVTPPDVTGTAGQSLMALLDEVAPVYPATRTWFLESYGQGRIQTPYDLARRILEADLSTGDRDPARAVRHAAAEARHVDDAAQDDAARDDGLGIVPLDEPAADRPELAWIADAVDRIDRLEEARNVVIGSVDASCQAVGYDAGLDAARRRLVQDAAEARARGIAATTAEQLVGPAGRRWIEARLDGRSRERSLEPMVEEALEPLAARVEAMAASNRPTPAAERGLTVPSVAAGGCPRLPFLDAAVRRP